MQKLNCPIILYHKVSSDNNDILYYMQFTVSQAFHTEEKLYPKNAKLVTKVSFFWDVSQDMNLSCFLQKTRPLIGWTSWSTNYRLSFWREIAWTHVLTLDLIKIRLCVSITLFSPFYPNISYTACLLIEFFLAKKLIGM